MAQEITAKIGEAWRLHRDGRNDDASHAFERIIQEDEENADAHYGLGLAQRKLGHHAAAKAAFEQALILIDRQENTRRVTATAEGRYVDGPAWNDPSDSSYDYYLMMKRMIGQRLSEVGAQLGTQK
jgi:tetratricopeptide (TPR) repeat protein